MPPAPTRFGSVIPGPFPEQTRQARVCAPVNLSHLSGWNVSPGWREEAWGLGEKPLQAGVRGIKQPYSERSLVKRCYTVLLGFLLALTTTFATDRYVSLSGSHVPPFVDWQTAATNIQAAVDAAAAGDQVWVTNGIYATGGLFAPAGNTSNRVLVTKPIVLQSVNGPEVTIIRGEVTPGTTNGVRSMRCVWLTDGATLSGFTLTNGSTFSLEPNGGGVFCRSAKATITNCIVVGNSAVQAGGGVFQGTVLSSAIQSNVAGIWGGGGYNCWLTNSDISGNRGGGLWCASNTITSSRCLIAGNLGGGASGGTWIACTFEGNSGFAGGGASSAVIDRCLFRANRAQVYGGGTYNCQVTGSALISNSALNSGGGCYASAAPPTQLKNCTVIGNLAPLGGGILGGSAVNCILYYNSGTQGPSYNYLGAALTNCCTDASGGYPNIITAEPRLMSDGIHLRAGSPCIGAGAVTGASGADYDGQNWGTPPSIGCDEWNPAPLLVSQPRVLPGILQGEARIAAEIAGDNLYCSWTKDGTLIEASQHYPDVHSSSVLVRQFGPLDAGAYQVIASNSFGMVTSVVAVISIACVDAASGQPAPPYANWQTAARSIQDAVDISLPGTAVLVTNGVYKTGAVLVSGDSTYNRVLVNKPISVLSVNGAESTAIQGGAGSVRCVWLGAGGALGGFTLRDGSTQTSGGGIWSQNFGWVENVSGCVISNCSAQLSGGGAYQGRVRNCLFTANSAGSGGGAASVFAEDCTLRGNSGAGAAYLSSLERCSIVGNTGIGVLGGRASFCLIATNTGIGASSSMISNSRIVGNMGGGGLSSVLQACLVMGHSTGANVSTNLNCTFSRNGTAAQGCYSTNCIFWFNQSPGYGTRVNCMLPPEDLEVLRDARNVWLYPNLLSDGYHVAADSPCFGRATNTFGSGSDLEGQPWSSPLAIGCLESNPQPVIVSGPRVWPSSTPGQAQVAVEVAGQTPHCWWTKDGALIEEGTHYRNAHTSRLSVLGFGPADAGAYQVVASNSFGMATSTAATIQVACVNPASGSPSAPYATWETAARSIQDAIDAVPAQGVIIVTNGVYNTGGRRVLGVATTNRIVLDKPVTLLSTGGAEVTVIEGEWDAVLTNGPASVRCAWVGEGAIIGGFTLRNGSAVSHGGGVWSAGVGLEETVIGCVITNCSAGGNGGGAWQGRLRECIVTGNIAVTNGGGLASAFAEDTLVQSNSASRGGGISGGVLRRCRIIGNRADMGGGASGKNLMIGCALLGNEAQAYGGAYGGRLFHCTVVSNLSHVGVTGGADFCDSLCNSLLYFNSAPPDPRYGDLFQNVGGCSYYYSICSTPVLPTFTGTTNNPQLLDLYHLAATSPCRGLATNLGTLGTPDLDERAWATPASIGCSEVDETRMNGNLSLALKAWPQVAAGGEMPLNATIDGWATRIEWNFGEGVTASDQGFNATHVWTIPGDYTVTAAVFNFDHPNGVSASVPVRVVPLVTPVARDPNLSQGTFSLQFEGQPGLTYELETTPSLAAPTSWQPVARITSTGGVSKLADPNATGPVRFYRLSTLVK